MGLAAGVDGIPNCTATAGMELSWPRLKGVRRASRSDLDWSRGHAGSGRGSPKYRRYSTEVGPRRGHSKASKTAVKSRGKSEQRRKLPVPILDSGRIAATVWRAVQVAGLLYAYLARGPFKTLTTFVAEWYWRARRDSNPRPSVPKVILT